MRSVSWAALLVPLLFFSIPAAARGPPSGRVSRTRTVHVSATPGEASSELRVAGGNATIVTVDVPLGSGGPRLQDETGRVRLVPVDGSSFIVLAAADLSEGERLPLTVPLQSGDSLQLSLVTRRGEVDAEVRLVRLRAPVSGEDGVGDVARLLNAAPEGQVVLALPDRMLRSGNVDVRVESILRMGPHAFITLSTRGPGPSDQDWKQVRLRAMLEDGASVVLPVLRMSAPLSAPSAKPLTHRHHSLVAALPAGSVRLEVVVQEEGRPESTLSWPLGLTKATP
ncbi:DUF2381 family protein [Vitiosangium sp. GDMCC 1.1324]|uniref:DUF2381 family protein n=1 Tax=Vitiosangium sp. (strain GDMCC 1.1324) TaxID=2138576 RepID=UPI000D33489A|nr:DUF2381 family protein [Vitiosangium sp. GDMCC 1.1324]PTL83620.1 hypothetical protein DAT35_09025 [Vitiosangium sp. GDMCC 1.1324]